MLIIFEENDFIFKIPIDIAGLSCIMGLSACLVLVNFEFIMTEHMTGIEQKENDIYGQ